MGGKRKPRLNADAVSRGLSLKVRRAGCALAYPRVAAHRRLSNHRKSVCNYKLEWRWACSKAARPVCAGAVDPRCACLRPLTFLFRRHSAVLIGSRADPGAMAYRPKNVNRSSVAGVSMTHAGGAAAPTIQKDSLRRAAAVNEV